MAAIGANSDFAMQLNAVFLLDLERRVMRKEASINMRLESVILRPGFSYTRDRKGKVLSNPTSASG